MSFFVECLGDRTARAPPIVRVVGDPVLVGFGRTREAAVFDALRGATRPTRLVCWAPRYA